MRKRAAEEEKKRQEDEAKKAKMQADRAAYKIKELAEREA